MILEADWDFEKQRLDHVKNEIESQIAEKMESAQKYRGDVKESRKHMWEDLPRQVRKLGRCRKYDPVPAASRQSNS